MAIVGEGRKLRKRETWKGIPQAGWRDQSPPLVGAILPLTAPPYRPNPFTFFPAPPPSPPGPIPSQHKTPGWRPGTAQQKSSPSRPQSWRDAACNQRPAAQPATPASPAGNNRPAPVRNFHAGNSARRPLQKSRRPARAIALGPWPRRFVVWDSRAKDTTSAQSVLIPYWFVLICADPAVRFALSAYIRVNLR